MKLVVIIKLGFLISFSCSIEGLNMPIGKTKEIMYDFFNNMILNNPIDSFARIVLTGNDKKRRITLFLIKAIPTELTCPIQTIKHTGLYILSNITGNYYGMHNFLRMIAFVLTTGYFIARHETIANKIKASVLDKFNFFNNREEVGLNYSRYDASCVFCYANFCCK